ncbi:Pyruvate kinase II [Candidatus Providencia siddallii]|uniref:Pyruvate kinase n=1 Tax=Candidatus Providencia siddallii TaxID=1715285 RepID=A0A0M6W7C3_9GAMM|nr:Pyruvate kinase II [Candidatus Providencia siddallii]
MLKRFRRTKIITTLGPATDSNHNIEKIINNGANVIRLNFSHGASSDHIERANKARKIAADLKKHIAIIGDLQGPKIRISTFEKGKIFLKINDEFILDTKTKEVGNQKRIGVNYINLTSDIFPNDILLLDDGRIQLKVREIHDFQILTNVIVGGELSNNKGINKFGGGLSANLLTNKDIEDIKIAAKIDVDYLAVSFPRSAEDLYYTRNLAYKSGCKCQIIAKIERAEAVANDKIIDEVILASDAIMIARGDLGIEIGDAELIAMQKKIIRRARQLNRVVITATQMMESMTTNPMPTRAEVMDVANAVLDGTDAVMLSAETATGQYPSETVKAMSKVCFGAEKIPDLTEKHSLDYLFKSTEEAIAMATMYTANHLKNIKAIIAMTESGRTVRMMSRISSELPIFAISRHNKTLNQCALYRGVTPIHCNIRNDGITAANEAITKLRNSGYLITNDLVLVTQGDLMGTIGSTNTCRILEVK